jgi:hypothetical protein
MKSSNNSLEFDNGTSPLTEREFFDMIQMYKQNNNYNDDGIERKDRMNFDPENGLEGLFGNEIEGHYNELGSGYIKGNSNNGTYKVTVQNEAGEEVPYFVKFVGNSQELKRFKNEKRGYNILQDINAQGDLAMYMQDYNLYEKALKNINNKESITEGASKVINFIKKAIREGFYIIENKNIVLNPDCDEKKFYKILKEGHELNLLSFDIDQGKRTASKGYKYNGDGVSHFNTMADAHWQNMLAQVFDEKDPCKFSHDNKNYEIAFTPIRKITTNNGKIFITKGTSKKVWNQEYNDNVLQLDQETNSGNTVKGKILDTNKILLMCGINDMHCGNVGSEYDEKSKTWKIDAFDIRHENNIIECIKEANKNGKFNNAIKSFYSRLFSKESIEKICNYLKDKNMKHETKSYMNDVLRELSEVKKYLESRNIIIKNNVQFPKNLDEAKTIDFKRYDSQKNIKVNNWLSPQSSRKNLISKPHKPDIKEQLNNNLGTLYARYTKKNGIDNKQYQPYQNIKPQLAEPQAIEIVGSRVKAQKGLDQTQHLKFR